MKNCLLLILIIYTLTSCKETPESNFNRDDVSFTCPKGWEILEEENFDDNGYYLNIEKNGFTSSGMISMTWVNNELDLDEWINTFKSDMKENVILKGSGLKFEDYYYNEFNNISATAVNYSLELLGLKHHGIIYGFIVNGKTFAILKQEALEDESKNKEGFSVIEKSFKVI